MSPSDSTLLLYVVLAQLLYIGYTLLLTGYARTKHAANLLMTALVTYWLAAILYWAVGSGLSGGASLGGWFGGTGFFSADSSGTGPVLHWWSRITLTALAACVAMGGAMGRTRFAPIIVSLALLAGFVFPVTQHWTWGNGWLEEQGFLDLGGAATLHLAGGVAALMATLLIKPRYGRYMKDGTPTPFPGHNLPLSGLGVGLIGVGWIGVHLLRLAETGQSDAMAAVVRTTLLAQSAGALGAMFLAWGRFGKPDVTFTFNGSVAGLVSVAGIVPHVGEVGSVVIAAIGGLSVVAFSTLLDRWKVDDPGGVIPMHGIAGLWGAIAVGLLHSERGVFVGGGFGLLAIQLVGSLAIIAFVAVATAAVTGLMLRYGKMRAHPEEEYVGLDVTQHANEAYADFQRVEFK